MCTIAVLHRIHPELPVVIAANRDEAYARASAPPRVLLERPRAAGGVDLVAGGTWLAVTAQGAIAAVTNQRTFKPAPPAARSRGQLVLDLVRSGGPAEMLRAIAAADPADYNPFNLIFGDAGALWVAYARAGRPSIEVEAVPPGIHVLPNDRLNSPDFRKVGRLLDGLAAVAQARWAELAPALAGLLGDHWTPPIDDVPEPPPGSPLDRARIQQLHAVCVHTPGYGTRSSTLIALAPGGVAHYLHAEGPPCTTPFADQRGLLDG